jgi:hypothetical protein
MVKNLQSKHEQPVDPRSQAEFTNDRSVLKPGIALGDSLGYCLSLSAFASVHPVLLFRVYVHFFRVFYCFPL